MEQEERIVITPPGQLAALRGLAVTPACAAYWGSREGRLTGQNTGGLRGGFLAFQPRDWDGVRRAEHLCREIVQECAARHFCGVLLTGPGHFIPRLEELLEGQRLRLLVPESCAGLVRRAGVYLSSALSGGRKLSNY